MAERSRYQFGIRSILALTLLVAVLLAILIRLELSRFVYGVIAVYFGTFFGWAVIRMPGLIRDWSEYLDWRRDFANRKQQMIDELREKRKNYRNSQDSDPMSE